MNNYILKIISTPIGNLEDISQRAINALQGANFIICESMQKAKILTKTFDLSAKLIVYNDHSTEKQRKQIANLITGGNSVALISDAGTPLISDPGYKLIRYLKEENIAITHISGASAVISALLLSFMPTDRFIFLGFFPQKRQKLQEIITNLQNFPVTAIFFESSGRMLKTIEKIKAMLPKETKISVVKEISKIHEQTIHGTMQEVETYLKENKEKNKGEMVLVLEPLTPKPINTEQIKLEIKAMLAKEQKVKEILQKLQSKHKNINKKFLYNTILEIKNEQ